MLEERWFATFTKSKSAAVLNSDVGYLEPHCDSVWIVHYSEKASARSASRDFRTGGAYSALGSLRSAKLN